MSSNVFICKQSTFIHLPSDTIRDRAWINEMKDENRLSGSLEEGMIDTYMHESGIKVHYIVSSGGSRQ